MKYTAKFAHLEKLPDLKIGQLIKRGEEIGIMGNTGKSTGAHLHFDLTEGFISNIWRLSDIEISRDHAEQSAYFIDNELFNTKIKITTHYCDSRYIDEDGKLILHPGYDCYPSNKLYKFFKIFWNRSMPGQVLKVGLDVGYGYYCLIGFDA